MNMNTGLLINGDDFSIKDAAIIGAAAALVAGIGVAIHKLRKNADDDFDAEDGDLFDENEPEEKISEPVKEEAAPAQDSAPINNENPEPAKFTVVDENGNPVQ